MRRMYDKKEIGCKKLEIVKNMPIYDGYIELPSNTKLDGIIAIMINYGGGASSICMSTDRTISNDWYSSIFIDFNAPDGDQYYCNIYYDEPNIRISFNTMLGTPIGESFCTIYKIV